MRILWVKTGKLLPLDSGGKLRTYNILRGLAAAHDLTYLSYYGGPRDEAYEREVLDHLPNTVCVNTGAPEANGLAHRLDYLRRLYWRAPYTVSRFTHPTVQRLLADWLPQRRFDVAVCDFMASTLNFPKRLDTPTVLFQHNVETVLWERRSRVQEQPLERLASAIEHAKMRRYEPAQVRRFHHVIAVSEQDRQAMARMVDPSRISVVPTGVDLKTFRFDPDAQPEGPVVVFTGSMDWNPNIDAVEYFCRDIWPAVLAEVPGARFRIVGRSPHARVKKLASPTVEVTGDVPSVVDHLRRAAVVVVPLRIGGGTRIKIYEGMAVGKATVSTTVGAEGLDVRHGRDIVLADDPAGFAQSIVAFLRDEELRRRYEAAAAATARQYDWSIIAERFAAVLQHAVRDAACSPLSSEPEPVAVSS
jgi:glycosyltransferase involved in cell wall biosynthesis